MNRREILLDKAEELFSEHGFEGTSIRQLAKEANMNIAMISYYFGSKEKLFEALVDHRISTFHDRIRDLNDQSGDPLVRLEEIIRLYVERFLQHPKFHRVLVHEVSLNRRPELQHAVAEALMRNVQELRRVIRDGIDSGIFRNVDVDLAIVSLVGTLAQLVTASPEMHSRMLGQPSDNPIHELPLLHDRLLNHLRQLMLSLLLKQD